MDPAGSPGSEADTARLPTVVILPPRRWAPLRIGELWSSRELLHFLAWRDIKVRYTQAALGAAWAVLQPFLMMVLFALVFGRLAHLPSEGTPYPVFAFTGLLPWTFFANGVSSSTESLVSNSTLVSKVYFPRLLVPLASLLSWLPDLVIACGLLGVMMFIYGIVPAWTFVFLPGFAAFAFLAAASVSVWLSALNVAYRDVRYAVPFVIQLWLFATPVVYPASLVPSRFRLLLGLNPMSGVVEGFRWALLGRHHPEWPLIAVSAGMAAGLLTAGLFYFRRMEQSFADVI